MNLGRFRTLCVTVAAAGLSVAMLAPTSFAGPPAAIGKSSIASASDTSASSDDVSSVQFQVTRVAKAEPGYGGAVIDADNRQYTVYLVGEPSQALLDVISEVSDVLEVRIAAAQATLADVQAAARLVSQLNGVDGVFNPMDGSGQLVVDVVGDALPPQASDDDWLRTNIADGVSIDWQLHKAPVASPDSKRSAKAKSQTIPPKHFIFACRNSAETGSVEEARMNAALRLFRVAKQAPHRYAGMRVKCGEKLVLFGPGKNARPKLRQAMKEARQTTGLKVKWKRTPHARSQMRKAERKAAQHPGVRWTLINPSGRKVVLVAKPGLRKASKKVQRKKLRISVPFKFKNHIPL